MTTNNQTEITIENQKAIDKFFYDNGITVDVRYAHVSYADFFLELTRTIGEHFGNGPLAEDNYIKIKSLAVLIQSLQPSEDLMIE